VVSVTIVTFDDVFWKEVQVCGLRHVSERITQREQLQGRKETNKEVQLCFYRHMCKRNFCNSSAKTIENTERERERERERVRPAECRLKVNEEHHTNKGTVITIGYATSLNN